MELINLGSSTEETVLETTTTDAISFNTQQLTITTVDTALSSPIVVRCLSASGSQVQQTPQSSSNIVRNRSSSFSLPVAADLFLSVFRTPSRSAKTSPTNQDQFLPSSISSPTHSCCSSSSSGGSGGRDCEVCAICLSPMKSKQRPTTRTTCRHLFHTGCLQEAKQNCRSECPLCRSVLSPVAFLRYDHSANGYGSEQSNNNVSMTRHNMRGAVVAAASRGREAVRRAMMMRAENSGFDREDDQQNLVSVFT